MAKLSRVSLERKRELSKPDRFMALLQTAAAYVSRHRRFVISAVALVLVLALSVSLISYWNEKSEQAATVELTALMNRTGEAAELQESYQALYEKHGGSVAGRIAGLKYADTCYQKGDMEAAIAAYQRVAGDFKNHPPFRRLAWQGLGYAREAVGDYEEAARAFEKIIEDSGIAQKDLALFNLGRMYDQMGEVDRSRNAFDRLVTAYPDSMYAPVARSQLI